MDWPKAFKLVDSPPQANDTQALNLPPNILDSLIPGYTPISQYAQAAFGIDISLFVTLGVLFLATTKGSQYALDYAERAFRYLFMSSVYIEDGDDLFDMVMTWLDARESAKFHRSVRAKTQRGSQWDDANDSAAGEALDVRGLFDYNKWAARTPPRYEPYYGRHLVWHAGRLFVFKRSRKPAQQTLQLSWGHETQDDLLQLDCIGRTTAPIKDLIKVIKSWNLDKKRNMTTIRHPTPKDRARYGGAWSKTSMRPSRPMETVILDDEQKAMILKDMNDFLHPSTPKWYATRGIPYRRGYLFHGSPGTGKTSLSFSLAGVFGLDVYAISLQDPTMTEGDLMQLFNGLPKRCIVLLEDVDAAGLVRDGSSDDVAGKKKVKKSDGNKEKAGKDKTSGNDSKKEKKEESKHSGSDFTLKDLAKEIQALNSANASSGGRGGRGNSTKPAAPGQANKESGTGVSLSGLLNAIDGVATHEGRVLIMTTNHPDQLDTALVRPGRVDRRVGFKLAMKQQIREVFVRMYTPGEVQDLSLHRLISANSSPESTAQINGRTAVSPASAPKSEKGTKEDDLFSSKNLRALAERFASHIPDDTFTPAEIQNHLMRWKKEPKTAIDTVDAWMVEVLEEKEQQRKRAEESEKDDDDDTE